MELAQAGMSQEEAPHRQAVIKSPHGKEQPSPAPVATVDSNTGQVDSTAAPQKLPAIDEQQPAAASAANDDYLQLDDDELLELACASMQPEQEGVGLAVGTAHQAVGSKAGDLSSFDQPEVPLPNSREVCAGECDNVTTLTSSDQAVSSTAWEGYQAAQQPCWIHWTLFVCITIPSLAEAGQ